MNLNPQTLSGATSAPRWTIFLDPIAGLLVSLQWVFATAPFFLLSHRRTLKDSGFLGVFRPMPTRPANLFPTFLITNAFPFPPPHWSESPVCRLGLSCESPTSSPRPTRPILTKVPAPFRVPDLLFHRNSFSTFCLVNAARGKQLFNPFPDPSKDSNRQDWNFLFRTPWVNLEECPPTDPGPPC